jgi:hypothetical protein
LYLYRIRTIRWLSIGLLAVIALSTLVMLAWAALSDGLSSASYIDGRYLPVQDEPEIIAGDLLEHISWGAVLAGSVLALAADIVFSLLGVAVGVSAINPADDEETPDVGSLSMGGGIWIISSGILALAMGGWVAGRLAGLPAETDGMLHGVLVWAVTTIVSMFVLSTFAGRIIGGAAGLLKHAMSLMGSVTGATAQVAGNVVGSTAHAVGSVAGSTAQAAGGVMYNALGTLAQGVNQAAQTAAEGASYVGHEAIEAMPEVKDAMEHMDLTFDSIKEEVFQFMRDAGKSPEELQATAQDTVQDMKYLAQVAARHPEHADRILELALRRVFRRGEDYISDVDRDNLVQVLTERTNMTEDEIRQQIDQWEQRAQRARQQVNVMRQTAMERAQELRQKAEEKAQELYEKARQQAQEMYDSVQQNVNQMRHEVEHQAREAAGTTTDIIAKVAAALVVALLIGAVAAGLGGAVGSPGEFEVEDDAIEDVSITYPEL